MSDRRALGSDRGVLVFDGGALALNRVPLGQRLEAPGLSRTTLELNVAPAD